MFCNSNGVDSQLFLISQRPDVKFAGVGILYKKTPPPPPNLFSFIEPFSLDVWIYMTTAYLGASLTMFLLARWPSVAKMVKMNQLYS